MEKEKLKEKPSKKRHKYIFVGLLLLFAGACGWFSYFILPGHSVGYFSRFESSEEVVAYLHEPFDLNVTTSEEILTFIEPYTDNSCSEQEPSRGHFEGYEIDENIEKIIVCRIETWVGFPGEQGYILGFYITKDNLLDFIGARSYCFCL